MAIVKFVSDKDCQVFIDMELAGKVASESMLKVTLETGGYLIQVKDEDGNLIKEYDLEIKPSDNQLLQKIDETNDKLDDVIEILKNDSSLVFHCNRASFCHNGLYGFVDKKLNVVIPPIYYSVNEFVDAKAFVVRDFSEGRKTTMIDSDGNIFFNRWFDYIGESDDTILLGIENRIIVYSKTKCDKVAEYFNAGYDLKSSLVPVYKKVGDYDFYGYIDYKGNEAIPFIFNNVKNFDEYGEADGIFLGRETIINRKGYSQCLGGGIYDWAKWDDNLQGLEGIIDVKYPELWKYDDYRSTHWEFIPIWNNYKWIIKIITIINANNEHLAPTKKEFILECDYVLNLGKGYCVCKVGKNVELLIVDVNNSDLLHYSFDADDVHVCFSDDEVYGGIIWPILFIAQKKNRYSIEKTFYLFNSEKNNIFPTKYENINAIILPGNNVKEIEKNREYYSDFSFRSRDHIYLKVQQNGKYGIIDIEGKEVIPPIYSDILFMGKEFFKVKREEGWSLGRSYKLTYYYEGPEPVYEPVYEVHEKIYDDISLCSENQQWIDVFIIRLGNKYGCMNSLGSVIIPVEQEKINIHSVFCRYSPITYIYSFLIYKDNKVGFCEITYYYSNDYSTYHNEYIYIVKPLFEECVLLQNPNSVLDGFQMYYAAVRKDHKWGILDQKPRQITYKAINLNLADESEANYDELIFKYDSLNELKEDADNELKKRYNKYYRPWTIRRDSVGGDDCIVEEGVKNEK